MLIRREIIYSLFSEHHSFFVSLSDQLQLAEILKTSMQSKKY